MNDDLISRQAALRQKFTAYYTNGAEIKQIEAVPVRDIERLPSIDGVQVRHGEWVWVQYDANPEIGNFHCSKCRFIPADFNMAKRHLNYCPNCGARMDGDHG